MNMKLECDLSGIRKCMMSGLSLLLAGVLQAQNPIVQTCYTSDPAPMVHDGTLYVYS
jgi:arabinoxylan arabinofuranohydrolase